MGLQWAYNALVGLASTVRPNHGRDMTKASYNGLAMGIQCSPAMRNVGATYEIEWRPNPEAKFASGFFCPIRDAMGFDGIRTSPLVSAV